MNLAKLTTAKTFLLGPILDSTGVAKTDEVVASIKVTKNGTVGAVNGQDTLTHNHTGHYVFVSDGGDFDTLGEVEFSLNSGTNAMAPVKFQVVPVTTYDAIITNAAGGANGMLLSGANNKALVSTCDAVTSATLAASQHVIVDSGTVTTVSNQLTAAQIATGIWQDTTEADFTTASSIGKSLFTSGVVPGASGGLFIAGSNAATTFASLTVSGNTIFTGTTVHTGNVSYADGITIPAPSTLNRPGVSIIGNGSGDALYLYGGATGSGLWASGGALGYGIVAIGQGANRHGISCSGAGSGVGIYAEAVSVGATVLSSLSVTNNASIGGTLVVVGTTTFAALTVTNALTVWSNAVPWNSAWDTEVESEVNDALVALRLDHLVAVADNNDPVDNSIIAKLVSKDVTADWSDYANTTDSLEALRDRGDAAWITGPDMGSGANTITITVKVGALPLEGAKVRVTKGAETYLGTTSVLGVTTFSLDNGTWTVVITLPLYTFASTTLVVDGDETPTYLMTAVSIPASSPSLVTAYLYCYSEAETVESGVVVTMEFVEFTGSGRAFDTKSLTSTSDATGLVTFTNRTPGATYKMRRGSGAWVEFTIPAAATDPYQLPNLTGKE